MSENLPRYWYDAIGAPEPEVRVHDAARSEERYVAHDYLWHGRMVDSLEDATDWMETIKDPDVQAELGAVSLGRGFTRAVFKRFGQLDAEYDGVPSTRLGALVNVLQEQKQMSSFVHQLRKYAAVDLDVGNTDVYRLLYHAGIDVSTDDPDTTRSIRNFMSMLDNMNLPPDAMAVVAPLQRYDLLEDTRILRAVAKLSGEWNQDDELDLPPDVTLRSALSGLYNLLTFIDKQTLRDPNAPEQKVTNAQRILHSLSMHTAREAYAGLRTRTGQTPSIPYSTYIKQANFLSQRMPGNLERLDEESIRDLPRAIDRLLAVACLGKDITPLIANNTAVQETIYLMHNAIDNVLRNGALKKIAPAPITLQDAVVTLRSYLPPEEAAAAVERLTTAEENVPLNRDALQHRLATGRSLWREDKIKRPGYGPLS